MSSKITAKDAEIKEMKDSTKEVQTRVRKKKRQYEEAAKLDLPCPDGFQCRAILINSRAKPNRYMHLITQGDYTPVTPAEIGYVDESGNPMKGDRITVSNNGDGEYLWCKTPIEFFEEDQREKTKLNREKLNPAIDQTDDGIALTGRVTLKQQ